MMGNVPDPRPTYDRSGFHWRDGLYFKRLPDGSVMCIQCADAGRSDRVESQYVIPPSEWASIVASVSAHGETGETYRSTLAFHMGEASTLTRAQDEGRK